MALTAELVDNFNDNSRDTGKWLASLSANPGFYNVPTGIGGTISETGGQVSMTGAVSNTHGDGYYSQDAALDMTSSEIVLQLVTMYTGSGQDISMVLGADQGSAQYYRAQVQNNFGTVSLIMRSNNFGDGGADEGGTVTITWSATDHRWLRIRHDTAAGGTIYWDTAPDSSGSPGTWTNRRTLTSASSGYFAPTSMQVGFVVAMGSSAASPQTIVVDNFNTTSAPTTGRPVIFAGPSQRANN